ncbi:MAG: RnfABCDGE type electron transport complex subunit D [Myxococcales bacterium]|jgi:electron transport complex protein RnfD|nr:RnfABCDGE type electron transport complex subunit D [Myxococcales bacterium]
MSTPLIVSASPHATSGATTPKIMWSVVLALAPATAYAIWLFGYPALSVIAVTVFFCVFFETLCGLAMRRPPTATDGSAALTGLILALSLPPGLPLWICAVGAFVAIVISKAVFGGLGQNPFNPAMAGRVFLLIAFPADLTRWLVPQQHTGDTLFGEPVTTLDAQGRITEYGLTNVDAITAATPIGLLREKGANIVADLPGNIEFLLGHINGSAGETSAFLLLAGGIFLLIRRVIAWHIPVAYLGTVALFAAITHLVDPSTYAGPAFHLLSGGVMMGAWFIATDYVTSPMFPKGRILFGVGAGILTMVIRLWGGYPEGVSFAVLLMNACVPFFNAWTRPKPFGATTATSGGAQQ